MMDSFTSWARGHWRVLVGFGVFLALFVVAVVLFQRHRSSGTFTAFDMEPFRPYIAAYTTGVISNRSAVRVEFTRDVVGPEAVGSELSGGVLSFSPRLKGRLEWQDTRTLLFTPREPMPWGERYRAELRLDKIFDEVPKAAKSFPFRFTVAEQAYELASFFYFAREEGGQLLRQMQGSINTASPVDEADMAKQVEVLCNGKALTVQVTAGADARSFSFTAEGDGIGSGAEFQINIYQTPARKEKAVKQAYTLPSIEGFSLLEHNLYDGENQRVELIFSHPLDPTQALDGLVTLTVGDDVVYTPRVSARGNILTVEFTEPVVSKQGVLSVAKHLKDYRKDPLGQALDLRVDLTGPKPMVEFIDEGNILPVAEGGSVYIPFRANGLRGVDLTIYKICSSNVAQYFQSGSYSYASELVRVADLVLRKTVALREDDALLTTAGVYALDLSDLVRLEPGAIYRVGLSMRRELTIAYCEPGTTLHDVPDCADLGLEAYLEDYTFYHSDYDWSERDDPSKNTYYYDQGFTWKNIMATDIGLVAKSTAAGEVRAWATSLLQGAPLKGVQVTLLDYRLQPMGQGSTDGDGSVVFSATSRREPFLLVASQGNMYSYLPVQDDDALSFSTFDVDGRIGRKGLQGLFYGERDIWSPGDSIHMVFMLQDRLNTLPQGHPVTMQFYGPRGELLDSRVFSANQYNLYRFSVATADGAPTGFYRMEARVGEVPFSQYLRVETVKPQRLKVELSTPRDLYSGGENLSVHLSSEWLHGAPARGLKASVSYRVRDLRNPFPSYKDYSFADANASRVNDEFTLDEGQLNESGQRQLVGQLPLFSSASGLLEAVLRGEVQETGGGSSASTARITISPYSSYVGLRVPSEDSYYLTCGKQYNFEGVVLLPNGESKNSARVKVEVYSIGWSWWWEHDYTDVASYISSKSSRLVQSIKDIDVRNGVFTFPLKVEAEASGRYLVRVVDETSGHAASSIVYFGEYAEAGSSRHQTVLPLSADNASYKPGDKARIRIPSPEGGAILISVESGVGVLSTHWLKAEEGVTEFTLPILESYSPNVYVTATLVQPYAQTANDLPLRLYGTIPLLVDNPASRLNLALEAPAEIRSGQTATVRVRESSGQPMAYTLAVVDEGLLSITNFKTPDPWNYFNAKQALGVNTFDIFDRVIGAYAGRVSSVLSVGGGDFNQESLQDGDPMEQRFRPVARLYGPFELKAKGTGSVEINIENYIGRVRIMAVACNRTAYGSAQASVPVRSPLMAQLTLPDVVTPFDSISVPVTIFSGLKGSQSVNVNLKGTGPFSLRGGDARTLSVAEGSDRTEWFAGTTGPGTGRVVLTAGVSGGGERAEAAGRFEVINPNGRMYQIVSKTVAAGKGETVRNAAYVDGVDPEAIVEVSAMPSFDFERHFRRLTAYASAYAPDLLAEGVAQMLSASLFSEGKEQTKETTAILGDIMKLLQRCQTPSGGFAYWPQYATASGSLSCYVGEFLLEAKRRGFYVPTNVLRQWTAYQQQRVKGWKVGLGDDPEWEQAYRLYTLCLAGENVVGAMNRLREADLSRSAAARQFLAAAYRLKGNEKAATSLLSESSSKGKNEAQNDGWRHYYTPEWLDVSSRATLGLLAPLSDAHHETMRSIARRLREESWFCPSEIARYMLVMGAYAEKLGGADAHIKGSLQLGDGKSIALDVTSGSCYRQRIPVAAGVAPEVKFTNGGSSTVFLSVTNSGVPREPVTSGYAQGLQLSFRGLKRDLNGAVDYRSLRQGDNFVMEVEVTNVGGSSEMMMLDLSLPAGWRALNPKLMEIEEPEGESSYEFRDYQKGRVATHFSLNAGQRKHFYFILEATYRGSFYFPLVRCYAPDSPSIRAAQGGMQVRVTE